MSPATVGTRDDGTATVTRIARAGRACAERARAEQRRQWEEAAATLRVWFPAFERFVRPVTPAMLAAAGLGAGARVVDIASGFGEPALTAARLVGPSGRVVATDISAAVSAEGSETVKTIVVRKPPSRASNHGGVLLLQVTIRGAGEELAVGEPVGDPAEARNTAEEAEHDGIGPAPGRRQPPAAGPSPTRSTHPEGHGQRPRRRVTNVQPVLTPSLQEPGRRCRVSGREGNHV